MAHSSGELQTHRVPPWPPVALPVAASPEPSSSWMTWMPALWHGWLFAVSQRDATLTTSAPGDTPRLSTASTSAVAPLLCCMTASATANSAVYLPLCFDFGALLQTVALDV